MYNQDSFFDFSIWGSTGLACLSGVLLVLMVFLTRALLRGKPIWICIPCSLILFWLFVWLSPQVYYMYYRLIIPELPLQWVIWPPKTPLTALKFLFFQGPHNLSAHGQGLLGWWIIAAPFINFSIKPQR